LRGESAIAIAQNERVGCEGHFRQESCTAPLQFAPEGGTFTPSVHPRDGIAVQ
jgi:hypothetical protein